MPLSWNLGTLTSWNPLDHSRPVMGLLYFCLYTSKVGMFPREMEITLSWILLVPGIVFVFVSFTVTSTSQRFLFPSSDGMEEWYPTLPSQFKRVASYPVQHSVRITLISFCFVHFEFLFLGAFAKFRKATTSFVMSVRPSTWNSVPTGRIFMKFDIEYLSKICREIVQLSLNPDKNNGYFTWRPKHIYYVNSLNYF